MKGLKLAFPVSLLFVLFITSLSFAQGYYRGRPSFNAQGFYIGANLPYNSLGGDFDSNSAFQSNPFFFPVETIYLADPDDALGWGVSGGFRGPNFAVELAYMRSEHDDNSLIGPGTSNLDVVSLDFKYFFLSDRRVQPYLMIGGSYVIFEQESTAIETDAFDNVIAIADAQYDNFAIDFGGGVSLFLTRNLSLNGGITYRWTQFDQVDGVQEDLELEPSLDFSILTYSVGLTYIFDFRR